MPRNCENSLCCGAGGGQIWMGKVAPGERPAENRIKEALTTFEKNPSEKKQLFNQVVGHHSGDFEWTKHFSSLNSLIQLSAVETGETDLLNAVMGPPAPAAAPAALTAEAVITAVPPPPGPQ